jgi:hypothetical protein
MSVKELKQGIYNYVDALSYNKMVALYSFLSAMEDDYWKPIIETNLSEEEQKIVISSSFEYKKHPENFCSLDEYLQSRSAQ